MWETLWTFETARFCITCDVTPEDMDPADSFDDPETIEDIRSVDNMAIVDQERNIMILASSYFQLTYVRIDLNRPYYYSQIDDINGKIFLENTNNLDESEFKNIAHARIT